MGDSRSQPSSAAQTAEASGEVGSPRRQGTLAPDEMWFEYFRTRKPSASDVVRSVGKLHARGEHDQVVALINGALANQQSQPWMFEVLAMSMKLAGRSEKDIERALLSRLDFTTTDVSSLLFSAAFLKRLDGNQQALRLYQQASTIDPTRPEPYILAMKLAQEMHDVDVVQWACSGILAHVWTKDFKARHQVAEDVATDTELELLKAGQKDRAAQFRAAIGNARRRDLTVRVEWSGDGDLDLSVKEPFQTTCSMLNPMTASGGILVHDGFGPQRENCYEEYVCVQAAPGEYRLQIDYLDGTIVGKRFGVTIVSHAGSRLEKITRQTVRLDGPSVTINFKLEGGRRKQPSPEREKQPEPGSAARTSRQELIAQVRGVAGRAGDAAPVAAQAEVGARGAGQGGAPQPGFRLPAGAFTAGIGFQPVIGFINEGVSLSALAVVSADRRFVRISVAPFFNTLLELQTFSFQGGAAAQQGAAPQGGGQ